MERVYEPIPRPARGMAPIEFHDVLFHFLSNLGMLAFGLIVLVRVRSRAPG